jgi:hypothetical protein
MDLTRCSSTLLYWLEGQWVAAEGPESRESLALILPSLRPDLSEQTQKSGLLVTKFPSRAITKLRPPSMLLRWVHGTSAQLPSYIWSRKCLAYRTGWEVLQQKGKRAQGLQM